MKSSMIVTVLLAAVLAGCGATGSAPQPSPPASTSSAQVHTVETAFGPVSIPRSPRRAIALEGGVGPLLQAGITPLATADGDYPDQFLPAEYQKVKDLPIILGKDGPDLEKIAALKPDLMIGFVRGGKAAELSAEAKAQWQKLNAIAPTVLIRSTGSSQTKDATLAMAEALGHGEEAHAAKKAYEAKAADIRTKHAAVLSRHVFAAVDYYEKVNVYSPISWPGDTLVDAGAKLTPVSRDERQENATFLSLEQLGRLSDSTVLLYEQRPDDTPGEGATELLKQPTWRALPAVKASHAYGLPYFFADRYETGLISLEALDTILSRLE
ncbi:MULTISPECIES: ABC transporter substrate-binding protein [unclassified Luteococcus]|uniref:ABC transporter substrate-binding protein n=1 Tax=unclassified Luteococcus TaxID=2639923 RepID=UPI00313E0B84